MHHTRLAEPAGVSIRTCAVEEVVSSKKVIASPIVFAGRRITNIDIYNIFVSNKL